MTGKALGEIVLHPFSCWMNCSVSVCMCVKQLQCYKGIFQFNSPLIDIYNNALSPSSIMSLSIKLNMQLDHCSYKGKLLNVSYLSLIVDL